MNENFHMNQSAPTSSAIGSSNYYNPNCTVVSKTQFRPYKRCIHCQLKSTECLGLKNSLASFFLLVILLIIPKTDGLISTLFVLAGLTLILIIGHFINHETNKLVTNQTTKLRQILSQSIPTQLIDDAVYDRYGYQCLNTTMIVVDLVDSTAWIEEIQDPEIIGPELQAFQTMLFTCIQHTQLGRHIA